MEYSAEDFFASTRIFGNSISADGLSVLITTDESGIFNVYRQPLDGGDKQAVTQSKADANIGISFFPHDDRVLLTADQEGNELNHLFVIELDGKLLDLTPGENLKAGFVGWVAAERVFYIRTNERDQRFFDLYRYQMSDYSRELMFQNDQSWILASVSDDNHWLALNKVKSDSDSDVYLLDLTQDDAKPFLVTSHVGDVRHLNHGFTRDDRFLLYGTDEFGEFSQVWRYDLTEQSREKFIERDWDVTFVGYSRNGDYRVTGINADASTQTEIVATQTGETLALPDLPEGDLTQVNFSDDNKSMVFYISRDDAPSDLYVYRMDGKPPTQLTRSISPEIESKYLVRSRIVRFASGDLQIPALLYRPNQATRTEPKPALIWIHGGPGGQSRKGFHPTIQHLVNHGYAVLAVNNRGSSGYGKTFFHLDDRRHGEADLADIVSAKSYLQSLDWVDSGRIGVIGGSYGGYLTMAAMAFTDEFQVGIDIFGVMNWERTLKNIPPWWENFKVSLYDEMGDPATDQERHRRISPLFHAQNIKRPILIVQGANDPRVLQIESDEMVAAIRKNEIPVRYVLFPDEGHGFRKKVNRITAQNAYLSFLETYL